MLSKILGGLVGAQAADHTDKVGGASGALLGVVAATVLRRASLPLLIALTAGGYLLKKQSDKEEAKKPAPARKRAAKPRTARAKPAAT
ncbi:MAG: hypothetical protein ABIT16_04540 [Croceibacterium sp.]